MTATPVAPLALGSRTACPLCEQRAEWMVGPKHRACSRCLAAVLAQFYRETWDGFLPATVTPLSPVGVAG